MYNHELQVIDTQEKAYLLGLFYADGNIGLGRTQCRLQLQLEDKDLIFRLQELFPFFYIHYDRGMRIELGCYLKDMQEDMINNGCFPRKSFENKDNLHIPSIDASLIRHFIRGYYDGDGGCTLSYCGNKVQKRVYIYSASLPLLEEFKQILDTHNIKTTIQKSSVVWKLQVATQSYPMFYQYLYEDVSLYLERKKSKYDEILKTAFFIQRETPSCKFCGSSSTVCNGYDYYKVKRPRYLCKQCNRNFSAPLNSNIQSGGDELLEG